MKIEHNNVGVQKASGEIEPFSVEKLKARFKRLVQINMILSRLPKPYQPGYLTELQPGKSINVPMICCNRKETTWHRAIS
jgi:hypothetical protein